MNLRRGLALLLIAIAVIACGSAEPSSPASSGAVATGPASPGASQAGVASLPLGSSGSPGASTSPGASASPNESASPGPTGAPVESEPPPASAGPSESAGPADACSGLDANCEFFAAFAATVAWPVLCAVLPAQWHVTTGSYRHSGGGYLEIGYKRPDGALLTLKEGTCRAADGCDLAGTDAGDASLGPLAGTFVALDDGGFAIVVDRGASPSWLLVAEGLGATKTRSLGAAFAQVGG